MKKTKTIRLILCAMFAALSAAIAPLSIPIGPIPVNLTHVSVFAAAGLLGAELGAVSQIIYVLLGVMGLPVFAGFAGGPGILLGPTGGFIAGYVGCAFVTGLLIRRRGNSMPALMAAMYAGWAVSYAMGVLWYMHITQAGIIPALSVCVVPFLLTDIPKTVLSALLVKRLRPILAGKPGRAP